MVTGGNDQGNVLQKNGSTLMRPAQEQTCGMEGKRQQAYLPVALCAEG